MAGQGTGRPITFACAKCRQRHHGVSNMMRHLWEPTGRKRERRITNAGGSCRVDPVWQYEYECLICGHAGWSRHDDVRRRFAR